MATVKSKQVTAREATPERPGDDARDYTLYAEYTLSADGVTNTTSDVIEMIKLLAGERPYAGALEWEDLGTDMTADVGITGGTVDAFLDGMNIASAGYRPFQPLDATDNAAYDFTAAADTIDVKLIPGGGGAITAGKKLRMWVKVFRKGTGTAN